MFQTVSMTIDKVTGLVTNRDYCVCAEELRIHCMYVGIRQIPERCLSEGRRKWLEFTGVPDVVVPARNPGT